ncbi:alpha-L-glutamate ligase [Alphaproteobacteria bacterium]|nr:alpha-L-glutamate ligase [Alphaproteobacteria bacterium]
MKGQGEMVAEIFMIHENPEWLPPFAAAFADRNARFIDWNMAYKHLDLWQIPPEGVFYNRMSASSFTRDHDRVPELTSVTLAWLERHGRRVINGSRALQLEVNKGAQYAALESSGITVPRTLFGLGLPAIIRLLDRFGDGPVILKPNRGGKGSGVFGFETTAAAVAAIKAGDIEPSIDGVTLIQSYIQSPRGIVTRAEFIGGKFHYAVEIDATKGFELCPSEVCQMPGKEAPPQFTIIDSIDTELQSGFEAFLETNDIDIAGIEFVTDASGNNYTYDVNTNTNYNPDAEKIAGRNAPAAVAQFLITERDRQLSRAGTKASARQRLVTSISAPALKAAEIGTPPL